jgi:hypothetical protein
MKKNKYLVFAAIGFELITLILISLWFGNYLSNKGYSKMAEAFCVLAAFLIWFISLIIKLKGIKNESGND